MKRALIFDMDGVLLDSEPFWRLALREELLSLGVQLTEAEAAETMGIRIDQVLEYRMKTHGWRGKSIPEVQESILSGVIERVRTEGAALPGVYETLNKAHQAGFQVGLATSSPTRLIEAVLEALKLTDAFEVACSAEFERYGKPHPAIYLRAAEELGVAPQACLAIEDSVNGVLAAKSAQMICLAVPEHLAADDPRFAIADLKLPGLGHLDEKAWGFLTGKLRA